MGLCSGGCRAGRPERERRKPENWLWSAWRRESRWDKSSAFSWLTSKQHPELDSKRAHDVITEAMGETKTHLIHTTPVK